MMADTARTPRRTRFAMILWLLLVLFLVVLRPGKWSNDQPYGDLTRAAVVAALAIGYWFLHRVQGLWIAIVGSVGVLLLCEFPTATDSDGATLLFVEIMALAALGWSMLMLAIADEPQWSWPGWAAVALGLMSLNAAVWMQAHEAIVVSSEVQQLRQLDRKSVV